ncbi:hypothetical protein EVAR_42053_1 [Eumeta japonica]|uniref:MADF domain-containing protein n=1 Tax=Eumeta variegata TaxID=151549 RepID=A0A4C1XX01_EUMVA|nr:hypothetical protein EVAR_42053_1 [Eumeta japonica]
MTDDLIELVRQRKVIYDSKCKDYKDHFMRNAAWEEIAEILEQPESPPTEESPDESLPESPSTSRSQSQSSSSRGKPNKEPKLQELFVKYCSEITPEYATTRHFSVHTHRHDSNRHDTPRHINMFPPLDKLSRRARPESRRAERNTHSAARRRFDADRNQLAIFPFPAINSMFVPRAPTTRRPGTGNAITFVGMLFLCGHNFNSDPVLDLDSSPVIDSASRSTFNSDSAISHSSDFYEAGG